MGEASVNPSSAPPAEPGLLDHAQALWRDWRLLIHEHLNLASLEARQAGESLVFILAFGVMVGLLLVSAWLGVIAAAVLWLLSTGMALPCALILGVLFNLLGALGFALAIRHESRHLRFPGTLRSLRPQATKPLQAPT